MSIRVDWKAPIVVICVDKKGHVTYCYKSETFTSGDTHLLTSIFESMHNSYSRKDGFTATELIYNYCNYFKESEKNASGWREITSVEYAKLIANDSPPKILCHRRNE